MLISPGVLELRYKKTSLRLSGVTNLTFTKHFDDAWKNERERGPVCSKFPQLFNVPLNDD